MKFKKFFAVISLIIAAALFGGCGESSPILVGFSGQLTGKMSDLGVYARNGALLAIETINASGGVNGHPLKLVAMDDTNTPEGAIAADKELVDKGVVAIIGHITSSICMAAMPFVNETETIMISPTVSTSQLTGIKDTFFRTIAENSRQASELAEYARSAMDVSTVVTIAETDNKSYSYSFTDTFSKTFSQIGGTVLKRLDYSSSSSPNWDAIIDNLDKLKPEAILLTCPAQDAAAIVQRVRTSGLNVRILSGAWAYTDNILKWGGTYADGMVFAIDYAADNPNPDFIKFRESYKNRFGSFPNFASTFAYDAILLLAHGLKQTGGVREGLEDAMAPSGLIRGPIGDFKINQFGDVERRMFIVTVKDETFRTIEMR